MQCEADHLGSGLSDTLAELMAGSLLFIAQKLNLMSDSVLDGTLPILKAFKKSMVVSGCRHLESRLASPNSMILFATLCIPFIILLRLQGWDLVYYTSWHLLLNIFYCMHFHAVCLLSRQLFAGVSWFYFHTGVMARFAKLKKKKRNLNICGKKQFFEALEKNVIK